MTLNQKQGEFKVTKIDSKKQQRGKQKSWEKLREKFGNNSFAAKVIYVSVCLGTYLKKVAKFFKNLSPKKLLLGSGFYIYYYILIKLLL